MGNKKTTSFLILFLVLAIEAFPWGSCYAANKQILTPPSKSEKDYLDRLMKLESGGNPLAKNPSSSALGHFQFVRTTFLEVVRKYFAHEIVGKTQPEILQLRINPKFARRAALAYTRENASFMGKNGIEPTAGHLRLAFLLGPTGALRVILADPKTRLTVLLSSRAIAANPFMKSMTAHDIIQRAKLEIAGLGPFTYAKSKSKQQINVRCNLKRPSCRRWLFLAKRRLARQLIK